MARLFSPVHGPAAHASAAGNPATRDASLAIASRMAGLSPGGSVPSIGVAPKPVGC